MSEAEEIREFSRECRELLERSGRFLILRVYLVDRTRLRMTGWRVGEDAITGSDPDWTGVFYCVPFEKIVAIACRS